MYRNLTTSGRKIGISFITAALLLGAALAVAQEATPNDALSGWLGREFTVESSTSPDHMPVGGKFTFVFDSTDNAVRICTRTVATQVSPWRMDLAVPCNVELKFTLGTRYCTLEDVKAGNAEVLSSCHRMRSHDVALHPSKVKGAVEVNDVIAFLVKGVNDRPMVTILVDSPARVTDGGIIVGK